MTDTDTAELATALPAVMDAYPALFPPFISAGRDTPGVKCNGINHQGEFATTGHCGRCGDPVARRGTALYPVRTYLTPNGWERTAYMCYRPSHSCEAQHVAWHLATVLLALSRGALLVGAPVRVVKGRKVPVGTEAVVEWAGETAYGEAVRLSSPALAKATFVNADNVELALSPELATLVAETAAAEAERMAHEAAIEAGKALHEQALAEHAARELAGRGAELVGATVELLAFRSGEVLCTAEVTAHHVYSGDDHAWTVLAPNGRSIGCEPADYGLRWKLA